MGWKSRWFGQSKDKYKFSELLDEDAQPVGLSYNVSRRMDRSVHELLGLIRGILADDEVQEAEVVTLAKWLIANREAADTWPADIIADRVARVLDDDIITDEERDELRDLFQRLIGSHEDTTDFHSAATRLPLTEPPPAISFSGKMFMFTGKFLYGTRRVCEAEVTERGGLVTSNISRQIDYLVIGAIGSRDWIHSTHGRKIEGAIENIRRGANTAIIAEEHWERFLSITPAPPIQPEQAN